MKASEVGALANVLARNVLSYHDEKFTLEVYRKPIQERRQKSIEALDKRLKVVRIDKKRAG